MCHQLKSYYPKDNGTKYEKLIKQGDINYMVEVRSMACLCKSAKLTSLQDTDPLTLSN